MKRTSLEGEVLFLMVVVEFVYGTWHDKTLSSDILIKLVGPKFLSQEVRRMAHESGNLV